MGIYRSLTDTYECGNRPRNSFSGNIEIELSLQCRSGGVVTTNALLENPDIFPSPVINIPETLVIHGKGAMTSKFYIFFSTVQRRHPEGEPIPYRLLAHRTQEIKGSTKVKTPHRCVQIKGSHFTLLSAVYQDG